MIPPFPPRSGRAPHSDDLAQTVGVVRHQQRHGKRAIGTRLVAGQTLTESEIGLGDSISILAAGTVKAVGTGAGPAVSAPLSVIDPTTRRNLAAQADNLADRVGTNVGHDGQAGSQAGENLIMQKRQSAPANP